MSKRFLFLLLTVLSCSLFIVGCGGDGSDGKDGATVADIIDSDEFQDALDNAVGGADSKTYAESCSICHDSGSVNEPTHGQGAYSLRGNVVTDGVASEDYTRRVIDYSNAWSVTVTDVNVVNATTGQLSITYSVSSSDSSAYEAADISAVRVSPYDAATDTFNRQILTYATPVAAGSSFVVTTDANDAIAAGIAANVPMLVYIAGYDKSSSKAPNTSDINRASLYNGFGESYVYVPGSDTLAEFDTDANPRNYVSNESCAQCHGMDEFHYHHNNVTRATASSCAGCHTVDSEELHISKISTRVHGIHNSNGYLGYDHTEYGYGEDEDHLVNIGYPNNMSDCRVCHQTDAQYANATREAKFVISTCESCHGSWDEVYSKMAEGGQLIHKTLDEEDNCLACHATGQMADDVTLASIHEATSYMEHKTLGAQFEYQILSATTEGPGGTASVTWQVVNPATSVAYDVLNAEKNGKPNFRSDLGFSLDHGPSFYVAFFTGDDVTNQGATTRDGQPTVSGSFTAANTVAGTAAGTVVTSFTIPEGVDAEKFWFNIQGAPNIFENASATTAHVANAASTVKAFAVADGSDAEARRVTTDIKLCLNCHGTLALHGGSRINSIETCLVCHNPNATDLTGRNSYAGKGVDTSLDGKTQESYDLRYLVHAIHSATATDEAFYTYRSRGIYAFRGDTDVPANFGVGTASWNNVHVEYPRSIGSCDACHIPSFSGMADQAEAIALTIDQGSDLTTHADDTVIGPNAAACISCHRGNLTSSASMKAHAESFGYNTSATTKDAILEAAE
jgi:OmcA/MtrC family decaheme c-type cytochrome